VLPCLWSMLDTKREACACIADVVLASLEDKGEPYRLQSTLLHTVSTSRPAGLVARGLTPTMTIFYRAINE
jgi:hypothetical protein